MKILFVLPVPYPLNTGGNQAVYSMLDSIRKDHDISVLFEVNSHLRPAVNSLKKKWDNVEFYEYHTKESDTSYIDLYRFPVAKTKGLYYRLLSAIARTVVRKKRRVEKSHSNTIDFVRSHSTLYQPFGDLKNGFLEYLYKLSRTGFDLIQVEFYQYLPLIHLLPQNVRTVFVHHELRFIRNINEIQLFHNQYVSDYFRAALEKGQELAALRAYSHILTLTEVDRLLLEKEIGQTNIHVSPACIFMNNHLEKVNFRPVQKELVFVGSGGHFPNLDAMQWFCTKVIPHLRKLNVKFNLSIVGDWKGKEIHSIIQEYPEVKIVGFIEDLTSFLTGKISIVPIRIGSGMRMKILDSIHARSPLISTSKGLEGLNFMDHIDCLIADGEEDFAKAIQKLLHDKDLQDKLQNSIMDHVLQQYDPKLMIQRRKNLYRQFIQNQ